MKSLQVLTPAKPCIFNCPFCISKTHEHENTFENVYEKDKEVWKSKLQKIVKENNDLKTVVITGTNEPMQDEDCVEEIIEIVRESRADIQIEIQTRFYAYKEAYDKVDVTAYSVSSYALLDKVYIGKGITRITIILTDSFQDKHLYDILNKMDKRVTQVTCKILHDSNGYNPELDDWIREHRLSEEACERLHQEINEYDGEISIFFDRYCMEAEDRYMVFREDGHLYKDYGAKEYIL